MQGQLSTRGAQSIPLSQHRTEQQQQQKDDKQLSKISRHN